MFVYSVNNIKVETLDPNNIIAKLYTKDYNSDYKIELINRINKHYLNKAKQYVIKEGISKNMMLNYTRTKTQRYRIHRYHPLLNNMTIFTRKRSYDAHYCPVLNVALQNTTNTNNITDVTTKESIQTIPQKISNPISVENKAIKSKITRPKIKIDIIGKNKVTLKKIIGANNKLRICSHKYVSNK